MNSEPTRKVLIVEDEASIRKALIDLVANAGYTVVSAEDGDAGLTLAEDPSIDIVLLDLMLPIRDGIEVCQKIRERRPELYVIMLTAKGAEDDKVAGLQSGADDYITKPFGASELLARLESVGRRLAMGEETNGPIEMDGVRFHLARCIAVRGEDEINLTAKEAAILKLLHQHRDRAVTRAELLEKVWSAPATLETRTVDMTIANLRQKIESNPADPKIVVTVKGVGYAWTEIY
ncbi:MAG: response regulator transcription factor [Gemmatimonadetes bacterium]|nr:response regulator transcription factor [Gemmatimonadota bacterium]